MEEDATRKWHGVSLILIEGRRVCDLHIFRKVRWELDSGSEVVPMTPTPIILGWKLSGISLPITTTAESSHKRT